jgi:hypothetical protein
MCFHGGSSVNPDTTSMPGFDSQNSVILVIDGPIDNEVRPCRPSLRPVMQAERDKLARYRQLMRERGRDNGESAPSAVQ